MPHECEICCKTIEGKPFSLSNLSEPHRVLKVCEKCAGSDCVTISLGGINVTIYRDEFLRADRERLEHAVEMAYCKALDCGWNITAVTVKGNSDKVNDPLDEEC